MTDTSNNAFTPNGQLSRVMAAQILYNPEGAAGTYSVSFPDVAADAWYSNTSGFASSTHLMDGNGNGTFGPDDAVTREQLAAILYRYAQSKGINVEALADLISFTDGNAVSDWAAKEARWAVQSGLISGKAGNLLDPVGTATRAEVTQILMVFRENVQG